MPVVTLIASGDLTLNGPWAGNLFMHTTHMFITSTNIQKQVVVHLKANTTNEG